MKGRKPKPTAVKRMAGNPGGRPLNDDEPQPDKTIPPCPDHLSQLAQEEWGREADRLYRNGLLTEIDGTALSMYCDAWARWVYAKGIVDEQGMTVTTSNGTLVQSPYVAILNKAFDHLFKVLGDFGKTPSSRVRVRVTKGGNTKSKVKQRFLTGNVVGGIGD